MPLLAVPGDRAMAQFKKRSSIWPDGRRDTDRLKGVAKAEIQPSFAIAPDDRIFTIGSCFAREMERRLAELGFDTPMNQIRIEEAGGVIGPGHMNKYTVQSMANEVRWALGEPGARTSPSGRPTPLEELFLQQEDGLWVDPQFYTDAAPFETLVARREVIEQVSRQLPACRVVILTLGLAEAWFDELSGLYLNRAPPTECIKASPGRFWLHLLSYEEILRALEHIHGLLASAGHPDFRMLVSVSPVPFKATLTGGDAITANSYSKSVQRAAAEAFVMEHENVDYVPSFEIVTMTERSKAWEADQIHVRREVVTEIMDRVVAAYAPGVQITDSARIADALRNQVTSSRDVRVAADDFYESKQFEKAAFMYAGLLDHYEWSPADASELLLRHALALVHARRRDLALVQLDKAMAILPDVAALWAHAGVVYSKAGAPEGAVKAFERAASLGLESDDLQRRLAEQTERLAKVRAAQAAA